MRAIGISSFFLGSSLVLAIAEYRVRKSRIRIRDLWSKWHIYSISHRLPNASALAIQCIELTVFWRVSPARVDYVPANRVNSWTTTGTAKFKDDNPVILELTTSIISALTLVGKTKFQLLVRGGIFCQNYDRRSRFYPSEPLRTIKVSNFSRQEKTSRPPIDFGCSTRYTTNAYTTRAPTPERIDIDDYYGRLLPGYTNQGAWLELIRIIYNPGAFI